MFWDNVAWIYDVFANVINRRANRALCAAVETVLIRPPTRCWNAPAARGCSAA